jgi:hypothetical protein
LENSGLENVSRYFRIALVCPDFRVLIAGSTPARTNHRIESSDYSVSHLLTYKSQQSRPDYSTKPPSSWTSTSRCIQLYGPIAQQEVSPVPLA